MPKVSLVVNAFNEGQDLPWTVENYRRKTEKADFEAIIVADGTSDGSEEELREDVKVLKPTERVGCGKAKDIGVKHATGDVILHADAHSRIAEGTIDGMVELALESSPAVITPQLAPLTCDHACKKEGDRACEVHEPWDPDECSIDCPDYTDRLDFNGVQRGGRLRLEKDGDGEKTKGLWLEYPGWEADRVSGVNPSAFAYSRETLERIGGWNRYPGWWGAQELGLSLRALFTRTPILVDHDTTVLHRFRSWNHPKGKAVAPYEVPHGHRGANALYAHRVVFSDELWEDFWLPFFKRTRPDEDAWQIFRDSDVEEQHEHFKELREQTDRSFWSRHVPAPYPMDNRVDSEAHRAAYRIGAGLGNAVMCIPAIKALSDLADEPVDVVNDGLHQDGTADLLEDQPWVRKVTDEIDGRHYRYQVGSVWASLPGVLPTGAEAAETDGGWRTRHEVQQNVSAVRALGYEGATPGVALDHISLPQADLPSRFIAVGCGCAGYKSKRYPHWPEVAELLNEYGFSLVFLGDSEDDEPWMDKHGMNLCGQTTIRGVAGVLWVADFYVGIDNGLSHLASAVRTPSVVLYGPSTERKNQPWTNGCEVVRAERYRHLQGSGCAPCWAHPGRGDCRYKAEDCRPCMDALAPEYVAGRVKARVERPAFEQSDTRSLHLTVKQRAANDDAEAQAIYREVETLADRMRGRGVRRIYHHADTGCGGLARILAGIFGHPCDLLIHLKDAQKAAFETNIRHLIDRGNTVETVPGGGEVQAASWAGRRGADLAVVNPADNLVTAARWWDRARELVRPGGFLALQGVARDDAARLLWRDRRREARSFTVHGDASDAAQGFGVIQLPTTDGSAPLM